MSEGEAEAASYLLESLAFISLKLIYGFMADIARSLEIYKDVYKVLEDANTLIIILKKSLVRHASGDNSVQLNFKSESSKSAPYIFFEEHLHVSEKPLALNNPNWRNLKVGEPGYAGKLFLEADEAKAQNDTKTERHLTAIAELLQK